MKKSFKSYIICWAVLFALFNVISFVTPAKVMGESKFTGAFWSGYAFITAALIAHCVFNYFALSAKSKEKRILNIPLVIMSVIALWVMMIVGAVFMAVPSLPYWLGIVICFAVLAVSVLMIVSAKGVSEATAEGNIRLNQKTDNYRKMVNAADILVKRAESKEEKALAQKVYDAVRYSDSVSDASTYADETAILNEINSLTVALANKEPADTLEQRVNELLILIDQRNNKCKAVKRNQA